MKIKFKIIGSIILLFILIQFIPFKKNDTTMVTSQDFIESYKPPLEIQKILKASCYDCHSNKTGYPMYSNLAPLSWWIQHHVNEGKEHLNFSEFDNYNSDQKRHLIKENIEVIEKNEMPLRSYTIVHSESSLTEKEKALLIHYFKSLQLL